MLLLAIVFKVRQRNREPVERTGALVRLFPHEDDLARIAKRQSLQEHRVHNREHRSIRADTKRESQQCDRRKSRTLAQPAEAVANIIQKRVHSRLEIVAEKKSISAKE